MSTEHLRRLGDVSRALHADAEHPEEPALRYALTGLHADLALQMAFEYEGGARLFMMHGPAGWGRRTFLQALAHATGRTLVRRRATSAESILFEGHVYGSRDRSGLHTDEPALTDFGQALTQPGTLGVVQLPSYSAETVDELATLLDETRPWSASRSRRWAPDRVVVCLTTERMVGLNIPLLAHAPDRIEDTDLLRVSERHLWLSRGPEAGGNADLLHHIRFFRRLRLAQPRPDLTLVDLLQFSRTAHALSLRVALETLAHRADATLDVAEALWRDPKRASVPAEPAATPAAPADSGPSAALLQS